MSSHTMEEWMLHVNSMIFASMGASKVVELNRELTPILAELVTLAPENESNDKHPAVKQLFTWLVDPLRTGEEFQYVTDSLGWHVYDIMTEHFEEYVYNGEAVERGGFIYLGKVVAEALAVKCPILEGSWEQVAWSFVNYSTKYNREEYGFISECLGNWIIAVIGNTDLCPNPTLQIQIMLNLLGLVRFDNHNEAKALDSVMSALSVISANYIMEFHNDNVLLADFFRTIFFTLKCFKNENYFQLDYELSKNLMDVKDKRILAMLHDVSYQSGMIIDSCKEAKELNSIITLLKTIAGCARVLHEKFNEDGFDSKQLGVMLNLPLVLKVLLSYFKRSCQMPQLSHLAAECIMDVLELVLLYQCYHINVGDCPTNKLVLMYLKSLDNIEKVLKEVIIVKNPGKIVTSPVGQEILFKFKNPSNIVISPVGEEILLKYNKQLGYIFEACSDVGLDFLNAKWLWSCLIFLSVLGSD